MQNLIFCRLEILKMATYEQIIQHFFKILINSSTVVFYFKRETEKDVKTSPKVEK